MQRIILIALALALVAGNASADPKKYGAAVYEDVANFMTYDPADDGTDISVGDNIVVHSTFYDPVTGLGQENKL